MADSQKEIDRLWNQIIRFREAGDPKAAIPPLQKILKLQARSAELWTLFGDVLADAKNWDDAEKAFTQALTLKPDHVHAHLARGYMYFEMGSYDEAEACLLKVLELDPDREPGLCLLGVISMRQRDYNRAVDYLVRAIQINPKYDEAFFNLGLALEGLGMLDRARQAYEKSVEIDPEYNEARQALQRLE
jgi:tetratricopeptide (TPR) repeat protein